MKETNQGKISQRSEGLEEFTSRNEVLITLSNKFYAIWDLINMEYLEGHKILNEQNKELGDEIDKTRDSSLRAMNKYPNEFQQNALICIDMGSRNYWHFVINIMSEIIKLVEAAHRKKFKYEYLILSYGGRFVEEYLHLCNIQVKLIEIRKFEANDTYTIAIKNAFMPNQSHENKILRNELSPLKERIELINSHIRISKKEMIINNNLHKYKKIFIERKESSNRSELRKVFPQDVFHKDLIENGFQIIYLEDMNVRDQIILFSSVNVIAGVHGAAFANIIYMQKNAKLIEIVHSDKSPLDIKHLASICGIKSYYRVPLKGALSTIDEQRLMNKCQQGVNCLPLKYDDNLKELISSV